MDFGKLADKQAVENTKVALEKKGYSVSVVASGKQALEQIKSMIPEGASVMNGSSTTLNQIGYTELLTRGEHKWDDLHSKVNAENDQAKRNELRKQSILSDYYLGSVHALAESGEFVIASNTGSQLPHVVFTSPNLVFVVSTKKIVKDLASAMQRLDEYVYPLEDARLMKTYNMHTAINKELIFRGEAAYLGRKINFILVEEDLGF